jgi:ABC-type transporter Mla subunit MlaD
MSVNQNTAFQSSTRDKVMGVFALGAVFAILLVSIYGSQEETTAMGRNSYFTRVSNSYGITSGGLVSLSGMPIGSVRSVKLEPSSQVMITLDLDPAYSSFYRQGSHLEIDRQFAIGNVISGNGLLFLAGDADASLLKSGSMIITAEPLQLSDLMSEKKIQELVEDVRSLVADMGEIAGAVNSNQSALIGTLRNTALISENVAATTEQLPLLMSDVQQLTTRMNQVLEELGGQATVLGADALKALERVEDLAVSTRALVDSLAPVAEKSPILMDNLLQITRQTDVLLYKLNQHWLLGGEQAPGVAAPSLDLPADAELYTE